MTNQVDRSTCGALDPQPHVEVLRTIEQGQDPSWVTSTSPAWQHREMYDRALAFQQELRCASAPWEPRSGEDDPCLHGFLFVDARQAIVGACAFRLRGNEAVRWWGLQWVWMSPKHRRQGHLTRHWHQFKQRFGRFEVESPVSEAMSSFLAKHGDCNLTIKLLDGDTLDVTGAQ